MGVGEAKLVEAGGVEMQGRERWLNGRKEGRKKIMMNETTKKKRKSKNENEKKKKKC